jgi:nucleoside-diphosphate-sugar epimerase
VRTKYQGYAGIADLKIAPKVTAVFPSLVFGGDDRKPLSHIVSGWKDIVKWLWLVRWVTADGSFHFIHGKDIAEVVRHLLVNPQAADEYNRKLVLGNEPITVDRAIKEICQYYGKPSYARLPLSISLTELVIKVFKIQVAEWDRFCMKNRHFTHEKYVNPRSFNLSSYAATIPDLMQAIDN